jgi:hypothetical protein
MSRSPHYPESQMLWITIHPFSPGPQSYNIKENDPDDGLGLGLVRFEHPCDSSFGSVTAP